jgi:hypothetical protein
VTQIVHFGEMLSIPLSAIINLSSLGASFVLDLSFLSFRDRVIINQSRPVFFYSEFLHCGNKESGGVNDTKEILFEKLGPSCPIMRIYFSTFLSDL